MASVKAPRKARSGARPVQVWDRDHLDAFRVLADLEPLEWAVAWRLTLCGLRRSEVLGLGWDAVDLEPGEITVRAGRVLLRNGRTSVDDLIMHRAGAAPVDAATFLGHSLEVHISTYLRASDRGAVALGQASDVR